MPSGLTAVLARIWEIQQTLERLSPLSVTPAVSLPSANERESSRLVPTSFPALLQQTQARLAAAQASPAQRFDALIAATAARYGIDPDLVHAVVEAESDYNPSCRSHAGAMGLMQLMPETARALGVHDPYDPAQNLEGGVRYLRQLLARFHDIDLALAAYNAGPGAVQRYGGIPPYQETQAYVRRVLDILWRRKEAADR